MKMGKTVLDGKMRDIAGPALGRAGRALGAAGVSANAVTIAGFLVGVAAMIAISTGWFLTGLVLVLASRLADALDGAVARATRRTDLGGFLDIVLDFAFYGGIPLAFAIADPAANALPAAILILSFYVNGASFLAFSVMAERRGLESRARGEKSIFFTTGLAEATETVAVFAAMCLWPQAFAWLAWGFAAICAWTTLSRIVLAARLLS